MSPHHQVPDELVARFEAAAAKLLERAGGALSLAEAAESLKVSPQDLLDRLRRGTALGMKNMADKILVPKVQLVAQDGRTMVLEGLAHAVRPFVETKQGGWAALQWLIDENESLGTTPLQALQEGRFKDVEAVARHFVGDDEP